MAAEVAATFLVEQVREVIATYSDLISKAQNEFKELYEDLDKLKDALKKTMSEESTRQSEEHMIEELYEVQDTIDSWLTRVAASKNKRRIKRGLARLGLTRFNLAREVNFLRQDKVKPMMEQAQNMRPAEGPAGRTGTEEQPNTRLDQAFREDNVVGFEDEEETLIGHLREERPGLDTISIIGMAGLGKSTLARRIFCNPEISYVFPVRIWVGVPPRLNFRDVCLNIMKNITCRDMSSMSDVELRHTVRSCLRDEKFLLVMDDVCSTNQWNALKDVLPFCNEKSKVLITSRDMNVGLKAHQTTAPHKLRFLTPDESWKLLRLEVFGDLEECPNELNKIGRSLVEKCGGVPLTIVVMGGILRFHHWKTKEADLVDEWTRFSDNPKLGSEINKEEVISDLIKLTYDGLPHDLRDPFLYLGVFPDDYDISTWTLTRLWIAEGFIRPKEGNSLEETAKEHLDDLVSRSLLITTKRNPIGEVKMCRVSGMVREFCRSKASERSFFREMKMSEDHVETENSTPRLCLHSNILQFLSIKGIEHMGLQTRSFLFFQEGRVGVDPKHNSVIPETFPLLRILHAKSIRFNEFPKKITSLIHLRYIILCVDDLKILPEPISQLWNLQTIVVDTKSRTLTVQANIWNMIWLRHFKTKAAIVLDATCRGEAGKNIQTLTRLSLTDCDMLAARASNLKTLGIRGRLDTLFDSMSLKRLYRLENLKLEYDLEFESAYENRLQHLPHRFPSNLRRLTLSNTFLDWQHMSTLAKNSKLEVLKLKQNAFSGISWEAVDYVFRSLQYLLVADADLVLWEVSTSTFPTLRCLVLKSCENLKEIPVSLANHLDSLFIDRVRKSAVESAMNIENMKRKEEVVGKGKRGIRFKLFIGAECDRA